MTPGQSWYREVYLKSEHWRTFRKQYLADNPYCMSKWGCRHRATEIHHLYYKDWQGKSVLYREDKVKGCVVGVCRTCHWRYEDEKRKNSFWLRLVDYVYYLFYELWKRMW